MFERQQATGDKFWCCYVEGSGGFSYRHETENMARQEAERLAKMPSILDRKVYVLETTAYCRAEYPPVIFHEIE